MSDLDVRRETAIRVLREEGLDVQVAGDGVTIVDDEGVPEMHRWGDELSGRSISRLSRRDGIPRVRFFDADRDG